MTDSATRDGKVIRKAHLGTVFTPAAPIGNKVLFAGRTDQITRCLMTFAQPGLHIVVYGERGVGKTSLANVLPTWITEMEIPEIRAVRVDCNSDDTFASLWRKVFRDLRDPWHDEDGPIDPESIRFRLDDAARAHLIVIDELDRLEDNDALSLLADTVKTLSDHSVVATLMLVGVAPSIEHLIGEHESIVRCLRQVEMPRMTSLELEQILDHGYQSMGMTITLPAREAIVRMAEGLPHFVHLLGLAAGTEAINDDRNEVVQDDVDRAIRLEAKSHTSMSAYRRATYSTQPGHLYEEVLVACALARKDELGYFRASDVLQPLSRVLGRNVTLPLFANHLTQLTTDERGSVLQKEGTSHRYRYRFRDPILQPFAKLAALSNGRVDDATLRAFPATVPEEDAIPLDWPIGPEPPSEPAPSADRD